MVNRAPTAFAAAASRIHASFTRWTLSFSFKVFQRENDHGASHPAKAVSQFAPADLLQGILVVSSFGFWAVMLGLMPVLLFRIWLA